MTPKEKKLINLGKQIIAAAAAEPSVEVTQLKATKVLLVSTITHSDPNIFCQQVLSKASEMQGKGAEEVDIQYATTNVVTASISGLIHSALLIGRTHENPKVR